MHVLFVGGTGLISTAIARQLLEAGHQVTLFNRGQSENRLPPGAKTIHGDRKNYAAFEQLFADKTFDVVIDMVAFQPEDSAAAVRAFAGRTGQFIHCSTVCVYSGPVTQLPTTETEPFHSLGSYGQNKIECEKLLIREHEGHNFPVTIMRPSHSYGEGGSLTRSFGPGAAFVTRLRQNQPLIVQGDGNSLWAACHVDDVARGFVATMGNEKCIGEAYNITGEEWMTWNTYYQQVAEVVNGTFDPVHIPTAVLREIAPDWASGTHEILSWPSIFEMSKLKRDTGYSGQTISWKQGVTRTIAWLDSQGKLSATAENVVADFGREDRLIAAWREQVGQIKPTTPAS
ncbi:Nucleoside-diphosphate-sugar epimerase [Abditibacterium utsteinense]|uniref:Nucleoside-diphosphate-sugar epimerase n=1 Tax=Abditibacterium utsteinense TaxID=1960156 RepID=A0A2S8SNM0_9BACT|nr:NAD-dependent epimerase/dehydratase family protein [Abditibacterium utsteinense]PQV62387.1 Nucleoside-diphosphate-sugar epimerase [Abditibacterium utsteinense]